jgi:hypothetical protein
MMFKFWNGVKKTLKTSHDKYVIMLIRVELTRDISSNLLPRLCD